MIVMMRSLSFTETSLLASLLLMVILMVLVTLTPATLALTWDPQVPSNDIQDIFLLWLLTQNLKTERANLKFRYPIRSM